jgi:hypothetical protein
MCALLQFLLRGNFFLLLERIKNIDSILQYNVYKINYIYEGKSNQSQLQYKKKSSHYLKKELTEENLRIQGWTACTFRLLAGILRGNQKCVMKRSNLNGFG